MRACVRALAWVNAFACACLHHVCVGMGALACACACSFTYPVCQAKEPYFHLRPLRYHHFIRHYLINGTLFRKMLLEIKCVFWFFLQLLFETFLILRRNRRDIVMNVETWSCKIPIFCQILIRLDFLLTDFLEKSQISNLTKLHPLGAELFHVEWYTDGYDEPYSRFSQFCQRA